MTYQETTQFLFSQLPMFERQGKAGYKSGLDNTLTLDEHFGHPHRNFKTIHVAGTNGKGSCSHTIAALLQANGLKVGLYTSPHLVDFRERIRVNGLCISEQYVVDFVEENKPFFTPLHPSFFELTTALAFKYFSEQNVDIAEIEVGLGWRLDWTNIITPILSVITNISFDHTQFLGNTLASIAREKAGIIKRGVPVVVGESDNETRPVFEQVASDNDAPLLFADDCSEILSCRHNSTGGMEYVTRHYGTLTGCLTGSYQSKNTNTILAVYRQLQALGVVADNVQLLQEALENVVDATGLNGRWQVVGQRPKVVCDTGHNKAAWQYLGPQLNAVECATMHIVFGMVDDKDINSVAEMLPKRAKYYFTQADSHRALKADAVEAICREKGLVGNSYMSVKEAYTAAMTNASPSDFVFVGGSSYVVADFLSKCF